MSNDWHTGRDPFHTQKYSIYIYIIPPFTLKENKSLVFSYTKSREYTIHWVTKRNMKRKKRKKKVDIVGFVIRSGN